MTVTQSDFRNAVLNSDLPAPSGLTDGSGQVAGKRFDVYRNNVAVSLSEALETAFPVIAKLLGEENFKGISGLFLRQSPPENPMMMHYGAAFPDFLRSFAPLAHLPYLGDVAEVEQAMRRSYHAADSTPLEADVLAHLPADQIENVKFEFAPSAEVLSSSWPIYDIWAFNMIEGAPKPRAESQDVLVTRIDFDPEPHLLPPGGAVFVSALLSRKTLGDAAETAANSDENFDLGACLTLLLSTQALTTATL
ncbi:HvfC/BufC N-terminal domain-containing protein [Shimia thalassica]|uniref:HvfC/BufC N-terminal domain-containing protein n=1 Tax=Shimia thalassica TaxID=1715693 RepID=UPI0026E1800C|nr:DNA-binding domain-containing protein [Shimia thalassica]MDO6483436.1 DNA-binding domain-containing protein [Shimia thalassica]